MDKTPFKKESYYHGYCPKCKYRTTPEDEDPCDECLRIPAREFTHRPINYKEATEKTYDNVTYVVKEIDNT